METLHQKLQAEGVSVLIIDVNESQAVAKEWADGHKLTFPVLLDTLGEVSTSFAPEGVLPELPRDQIPIGSNILIDREGRIQFYTLLDTKNFDARLVGLKAKLKALMNAESEESSPTEEPVESGVVTLDPPELVRLRKGGSATATISFTIAEGYHVLADDGGVPALVPMRIDLDSEAGISLGRLGYPASEPLELLGSELTFGVYHGSVASRVSIWANSDAELGERTVGGRLVFQSCNDRSCFPPDSLPVSIPVLIVE